MIDQLMFYAREKVLLVVKCNGVYSGTSIAVPVIEKRGVAMLSERDRAVVCNMIRTGMALETLKSIFKQFDEKDVEEVYISEHRDNYGDSEGIIVSYNCS